MYWDSAGVLFYHQLYDSWIGKMETAEDALILFPMFLLGFWSLMIDWIFVSASTSPLPSSPDN